MMLRWISLIAVLAVALSGCAQAAPRKTAAIESAVPVETVMEGESAGFPAAQEATAPAAIQQEAASLAAAPPAVPNVPSVEAPGILVTVGNSAVIDYSNASLGYVMVRYEMQTQQRLKVRVQGPNTTYTYNLPAQQWTAFPLSDENGSYQVIVYQNVSGTKYATILTSQFEVTLQDEFAPFLHANQYVNYDEAPNTVAKAAALTKDFTDPLEKVAAIYEFVISTLRYDYELAANVKSGYLPQLDVVLEKASGICFDYAALMTGMLRSLGIPAKLVVGYAGQSYHAWISVWTEDTGWIDGVIYFDGISWQRLDPTFAASAGGNKEIMDYIRNEENYVAKYFY